MSAARGACVPKKLPSTNSLLHNRDEALTRPVDAAKESAEVPGDRKQHNGQRFEGKAKEAQLLVLRTSGTPVNQPDDRGQRTRSNAEDEVEEQRALQALPFELPLPGKQPGDRGWDTGYGSDQKITVGRCSQALSFRPMGHEVKGNSRYEQRNRKMNQHNMLRVLCGQCGFQVERVHRFLRSARIARPY